MSRLAIIILCLLIPGCLVAEYSCHWRARPPAGVTTLAEFLQWRPGIERFAETEVAGQRYLIAYGPAGRSLPSGPAGYVFDKTGKLIDWSPDIGDDSRFNTRWDAQRAPRLGREIPREEAVRWPADAPEGELESEQAPDHPGR